MAPRKLNARQMKFVEHLLAGMGKRDAAAAAGYSPHTAANIASNLLTREPVLQAIRAGAEKKLSAGVAIGAAVLMELAEKAKSEDVRLRAAAALLDRGGLPLIRQSETRHIVEDRRSDAELLEHVRTLARSLGVALPASVIDVEAVAALPAPVAPGETSRDTSADTGTDIEAPEIDDIFS